MERHILAYIGGYRDFDQALLGYPDNPNNCRYDLRIVDLGNLPVHKIETLFEAYPPHPKGVRYAFFDELNPVQQLQVQTKICFLHELPVNMPIGVKLRLVHKAACLLRGEAESVTPPFFTAATGRGNPESAMQGMTVAEKAYNESIEWADKPAIVSIENINDIRNAVYEAVIMAQIAADVDKWHVVSLTKHNCTGWTAITDLCFPHLQKAGQEKNRENKARDIQRLVENHRNNIGWVPPNDDIF